MRADLLLIAALGSTLAACEDSRPTQPNNPIVVRSQAQDQLHQLDEAYRAITLRRAIFDSGSRCARITESGYVQEYGNLSMWTATCDDGRRWAIFVGPDGSAQVRACSSLAQLGLPQCEIREQARPAASG